MADERFGLDDLNDDEQLAFGALLRAMVSLDGKYSSEEKAVFKVLAEDLGEEGFWAMLDRASKEVTDPAKILELAKGVDRAEARELLFYGINATAHAGEIAKPEAALLDELRKMWGLEVKDED